MSLTQDINYWDLSFCQTHNQQRNLILTSEKGNHHFRTAPPESYLLSGVGSECHFQLVFLTECRDFWTEILDYKESLVRECLSPPPFVGSSVSVRLEGHLGHTWEPWVISGGGQGSQPPHCILRCTEHHSTVCVVHSFTNLICDFFTCWLHIYDVQYDEYCTGHLLSYRGGRRKKGSWFHYTQASNSDGVFQLGIYFSFPLCNPMSLERQPRDPEISSWWSSYYSCEPLACGRLEICSVPSQSD